jgi:phosphoribosylformimino-5-aminoimidazole carboxamide ribotide isomerase
VLIPCIDLQNGQAVQLVHGRRRELAVPDVLGLLEKFKEYEWLHIIDLDAAMRKCDNNKIVQELCQKASQNYGRRVRVGGGIRTISRASRLINCGAEQIIIGSAAFRESKVNTRFLRQLVKKLKRNRVIIALDTAKGCITVNGWRRRLTLSAEDVFGQLEPYCAGFLCTDVDREGTMTGANLAWFRQLRTVTSHSIIAAGGIKTHREIRALDKIGMDAAVGMAMYKDRLR